MLGNKLLVACVIHGVLTFAAAARGEFVVVKDGRAEAAIHVDSRNTAGAGAAVLNEAALWLVESLRASSGATPTIEAGEPQGDRPAIVVARADAWPDAAREAGLRDDSFDAYAIVVRPNRLLLLGRSEAATRHAVADLLRDWGFRWFAPSPQWHVTPRRADLVVTRGRSDAPALVTRKIWYAYGHSQSDLAPLSAGHRRWSIANRLSEQNLTQTGHSYGNIILRNAQAFAEHPEYFALLPDGKRDTQRAVVARKFCFSNPGLIELVAADRGRLLEEQMRANPAATMVSVDPSDGEGTCHCDDCAKLGTTTDRVLHLANQTARRLRAKHPAAWVGLYAYSSHRLPPTIDVEPNVYVQVAMGFNRTEYSLPELVELWSRKVGAIGLREYYGVEAWDWGLPGRLRGGKVDYHRRWIPYFAERKVNAINAETNSNWGGQTLGHYVAAQLMWNPKADVDSLTEEFFRLCFGQAAAPMRRLYSKFDAAPALRSTTLLPMFDDLNAAWAAADDDAVRRRLVDLMAYLVYVSAYRDFELEADRQPSRNDAYYAALRPLMQYAYQIRHRDMVHYYALARRLCNGLPLKDGRPDFYLAAKDARPVWMTGDPPSDDQIRELFASTADRLRADDDPTVTYSRYLERWEAEGDDAGPSRSAPAAAAPAAATTPAAGRPAAPQPAFARFRSGLRGYLLATGKQTVRLGLAATGRQATFTVYVRDDEPLHRQEVKARKDNEPPSVLDDVEFELPKAGEYRVEIEGDFVLRTPRDAPLVYEASPARPAWIDYSGPHYFYVPRGVKELYVDANPRVTLAPPGAKARIDVTPEQRPPGRQYAVVPVPASADGRVWHVTSNSRGRLMFLNVPPLLSFHRETLLAPRELAEAERGR